MYVLLLQARQPTDQIDLSIDREKATIMAEKREKAVGASAASSPMVMQQSSRGIFGVETESSRGTRTVDTMLRLVPMALSVASLVLMLKNSESNDFGSLSYSDLRAFRYLVHANGICAGYSLLSAVFTAMPRPFTKSWAWSFFFLDQVLTYIVLTAGAASTELVYLAYKGDKDVAWSEACGSFGRFCHKAIASVAITFVAVVCYAVLSLVSSYKLFSKYDAPVGYSNKATINDAAAVYRG